MEDAPKWSFNLDKAQAKGSDIALKDPLGFKCATTDVIVRSGATKGSNMTYVEVLEAKAWGFAKSPAGSVFQTVIMFWMYGSGVSLFSIMFTMHFIMGPIKAIGGMNEQFDQFKHKDINLTLPKLCYLGIQLGLFSLAVYKFSVMGVLPVTPNDWAGLITKRVPIEHNQVNGLN